MGNRSSSVRTARSVSFAAVCGSSPVTAATIGSMSVPEMIKRGAKPGDLPAEIVVHDALSDDPEYAYALARLSDQDLEHVVTGVFRAASRAVYDDLVRSQVSGPRPGTPDGLAATQTLLTGSDTWTV